MKSYILICCLLTQLTAVEKGKGVLEVEKFNKAVKDFSDSIESGQSKLALQHFLKLMKFGPNREIIQRIAELSGAAKLYPLAYHKEYDWSPIFAPDGKNLAYLSWQRGKGELHNAIHLMNIDGINDHVLVGNEFDNVSPVFSPDGTFIVFESFRNDTNKDGRITKQDFRSFHAIDVTARKEWIVVDAAYENFAPMISPDGKKLLFLSCRKDTNNDGKLDRYDNKGIYIIDMDGKNERQIASEDFLNSAPQCSQDSKLVVFHSRRIDTNHNLKIDEYDNKAIYVINTDGTNEREIAKSEFDNEIAAFSPDSRNLAFFSYRSKKKKNRGVYIVELESLKEKELVTPEYDSEFLTFSKEGKYIAYTSYHRDTNRDGKIDSADNRGIYLLDLATDKGEEIQIVGDSSDNAFLAFYPDSKKILFSSWRNDTNGDGLINILDVSGMYIVDIISAPTMKMTTIIKPNKTCTRVIEIVTDPLFSDVVKKEEEFLKENKWSTQFIKEGQYHFRIVGEFRNPLEISNIEAPLDFVKKVGLIKIKYEFKETIAKGVTEQTAKNPFLKFGYEMARAMTRPLVIQTTVAMPGRILQTNGLVKGNSVKWLVSLNELLSAQKDFEMFIVSEETNWISIVLLSLFCVSAVGFGGYRIYASEQKKNERIKELNKEYIQSHNYLAAALKNKKLYDEAIEEYKKALSFDPDSTELLSKLAECYSLKGDKKQEEEIYKKISSNKTK